MTFSLRKYFLFSFPENSFHFHFQDLENVFGLTSYFLFSENENIENVFGLINFHKTLFVLISKRKYIDIVYKGYPFITKN